MTTSPEDPCADVLRNPIHFIAQGFGSGCAPVAPGTWGTVVAVPMYWLVRNWSVSLLIALTALMLAGGVWVCDVTARDLGVHDHPSIVWDEIVGYFITMLGAPAGWVWLLLGFVLFRLFDIVKPWPISLIDRRVGGGLGIMLDDVLAGVYAWLVIQGVALALG